MLIMKNLLLLLFFLPLLSFSQTDTLKWKVLRYEQTGKQLFISIGHTKSPVYVEHFFTPDEQKTDATRIATIEKLVAELRLKAKDYKQEVKATDKKGELEKVKLSKEKVSAQELLIQNKNK
jgi:hypothetical protein